MRFDVNKWWEAANGEVWASKGRVWVRATGKVAVFAETPEGHEALVGYGEEIRAEIALELMLRVQAPKDVRVFVEGAPSDAYTPHGPVFTNIDKRPGDSVAVLEVRRALREFKLQQRAVLQRVRAETEALFEERQRVVRKSTEPDPVPAPEGGDKQETGGV